MAREDLLANLLTQLMTKEDPPPEDDNTLIQKMIAPNDTVMPDDIVNLSKYNTASFKWGGKNISPGWKWNAGQYAFAKQGKSVSPIDTATASDSATFTKQTISSLKWGGTGITAGWKWNQGQYT